MKRKRREKRKHVMLVLKSDCPSIEHLIWFLCGVFLWGKVHIVVPVEVSKVYKWWCNPFLRKMIDSKLAKKAAALHRIGKGLDQSYMNHCWRAYTLESCGDLMITRSSSSYWYVALDHCMFYMLMLFDCNHQVVSRALCSDSLV